MILLYFVHSDIQAWALAQHFSSSQQHPRTAVAYEKIAFSCLELAPLSQLVGACTDNVGRLGLRGGLSVQDAVQAFGIRV